MVPSVGVVIPAHDEETLLGACLRSVSRSLRAARAAGLVRRHVVVVVAHRCRDRTAMLAAGALAGQPHRVIIDEVSELVADARRAGAAAALAELAAAGGHSWLLSTDADTTVPRDWVQRILGHAGRGAQAVVGLADIERSALSEPAWVAYRQIVDAKIYGDSHGHVYGANLAVRADAYLQVGGFPRVVLGEDAALVDALAAADVRISRPTDTPVLTSARLIGRAHGGLADLLHELAENSPAFSRR